MLTEKELEAAIALIINRIGAVNQLLIKKIAAQLLKIGELNATSINRVVVMTDMGADIREITRELAKATAMNIRDVNTIYQAALKNSYTDPRFKTALQTHAVPVQQVTKMVKDLQETGRISGQTLRALVNVYNPEIPRQVARMVQFTQNVATQTAGTMVNLSNTTAILPAYREAVDNAITAVSMGGTSYTEAARNIINNLGYSGLQVQYESGYHRRLDSAVRQNIIDGVNQINQNASLAMGEALGFDAVEISAHANSAPDHEPVQGLVFLNAEFEKMQSGLPFHDVKGNQYEGFSRAIGEWNCMHIAMGFDTKTTKPRYTEEQLQKFKDDNAAGCEIGGKKYTLYEARQLMRQLETKVRREKDMANAARLNGNDMDARRAHQKTINRLSAQYYAVAKASGLSPRSQRLSVEGFRMVKV